MPSAAHGQPANFAAASARIDALIAKLDTLDELSREVDKFILNFDAMLQTFMQSYEEKLKSEQHAHYYNHYRNGN